MKKYLLLFVAVVWMQSAFAQDVIVFKNADEVQAKVTDIGVDRITYIPWDNPDGPTYTVLKKEVFYIKYANGKKDVFVAGGAPSNNSPSIPQSTPANTVPQRPAKREEEEKDRERRESQPAPKEAETVAKESKTARESKITTPACLRNDNPIAMQTSIGVVAGCTNGLSFFFVDGNVAYNIEVIGFKVGCYRYAYFMFGGVRASVMGMTTNKAKLRFMYGGSMTIGYPEADFNGVVGVVTNFEKPIELQLDFRPGFAVGDYDAPLFDWGINLSLRYRLGKKKTTGK